MWPPPNGSWPTGWEPTAFQDTFQILSIPMHVCIHEASGSVALIETRKSLQKKLPLPFKGREIHRGRACIALQGSRTRDVFLFSVVSWSKPKMLSIHRRVVWQLWQTERPHPGLCKLMCTWLITSSSYRETWLLDMIGFSIICFCHQVSWSPLLFNLIQTCVTWEYRSPCELPVRLTCDHLCERSSWLMTDEGDLVHYGWHHAWAEGHGCIKKLTEYWEWDGEWHSSVVSALLPALMSLDEGLFPVCVCPSLNLVLHKLLLAMVFIVASEIKQEWKITNFA